MEEKKSNLQDKLDLLIERNKNEASALQKIINAIETQNKKSIIKSKK